MLYEVSIRETDEGESLRRWLSLRRSNRGDHQVVVKSSSQELGGDAIQKEGIDEVSEGKEGERVEQRSRAADTPLALIFGSSRIDKALERKKSAHASLRMASQAFSDTLDWPPPLLTRHLALVDRNNVNVKDGFRFTSSFAPVLRDKRSLLASSYFRFTGAILITSPLRLLPHPP